MTPRDLARAVESLAADVTSVRNDLVAVHGLLGAYLADADADGDGSLWVRSARLIVGRARVDLAGVGDLLDRLGSELPDVL